MNYTPNIIQDEEGSALASVLIIVIIISLFIGVVLSGIYLQNRFIQQDINEVKARYAAEAGVYTFLNEYPYQSVINDTTFTFRDQDSTEITIRASAYGGFMNIHSTAEVQGKKKIIRILAGVGKSDAFQNAVVLGDTNSVLMLTGSTQLKGDALTGQEGTQTTDFKGRPFSGDIEGELNRESGYLLPLFDATFLEHQEAHFSNLLENGQLRTFLSNYDGMAEVNAEPKDTLFFEESISWSSGDSISFPRDLTIVINGNAIINGNYHFGVFTKLIVRDTLMAGGNISGENMLIYAGKSLQIGGGAELSTQAISGNDIIIRDQAYLRYPSMLYTSQEFAAERQEIIIDIRDQAMVDGTIIYPVQSSNFTSGLFRVRVADQAVVRGGIYTLGQTELEGKVLGSVLTHQFYFYESPSSYINWLKDAEIDLSGRPENYVIPLGFSEHPEYQILDWFEVE
ncbi:MAG: hypothetical protein CL666_01385 [Balneola sp.]|nr:hypothetical protein [Balneola sp.]|tara:strand:- start:10914 stop:12275 length:1362 start_codon:yes stop_codon:yes gene_type:complete